jgi:hypothetical protein
MSLTPTTLVPTPFLALRWLGSSLAQLVEAPGTWLTNFFDDAEDVWATDPLLSDDDDQPLIGSF